MSQNKNALIRYKTIDQCLRNPYKKWTLEMLIDACSDALYEYEGKDSYVSKRTVQLDIQMMRSEKLGYEAPIEVYEKKYYRYADPDYSIRNIPVTQKDVGILKESIEMLKQFQDFSLFREMDGLLHRLEDSVYSKQNSQKPIIHLDKNEKLKGLEFIDPLYRAVQKEKVLRLTYQSFQAKQPNDFQFHPQLLKEFNNRWFVLGVKTSRDWENKNFQILALDRIINMEEIPNAVYINAYLDANEYFKDVVGVTVSSKLRPVKVVFWVDKINSPYVKTKPMHHSQILVEENEDGCIFEIEVQLNFELERLLLGFAGSLKVLQPENLKQRILNCFKNGVRLYEG